MMFVFCIQFFFVFLHPDSNGNGMKILGLMSGTSLDGIDLALCDISEHGYSVLAAETVPYLAEWKQRLSTLEKASAYEYALANVELGHLFGRAINRFLEGKERPEAIASHGHTIFHQPQLQLTTQIGDGDAIAAETGLPVVSNFRTLDVALGGQGAPLVPIGDELLFGEYDACLNLGGIANISYKTHPNPSRGEGTRVAFDICPCNMALNRLAAMLGYPYDDGGRNARGGEVHTCLLHDLDALEYYADEGPKSLGKEWFVEQFWPLVKGFLGVVPSQSQVRDALATVTSHIAIQIARVLERQQIRTLLVTGGGAWNSYLLELLSKYRSEIDITVPDALIVNYKEALIFALLGYLRLTEKVNTLASVTGAKCDSIGGNISGKLNI
ncbi:MAG: anhydro-N-acetylmuramic acid kinase [Bacteroidales bacterium]|nr:anhydro-N-acetylmuramic acid kinase [Bacteroidales bacterium]